MQDNEMAIDDAPVKPVQTVSEEDEQLRRKREAEERVAKMFASAKTPSKRCKEKGSSMTCSDVPIASKAVLQKTSAKTEDIRPIIEKKQISAASLVEASAAAEEEEKLKAAEEKIGKMFADASISDKRDIKSLCSLPPAENDEQQEKNRNAEARLEELFSAAEAERNSLYKDSFASLVMEVVVLEAVSLVLFFITMHYEMDVLSLFAVLLPVIAGIGYRVVKHQLTLMEAVSKCKLHIAATVFIFICIIASV
ncbi:hypothetical protein [Ruminococcus sp.]